MHGDWDLPPPPGARPVRGVHPWRWVAAIVVSLALVAASLLVPIPIFFAYLPGPVKDVEQLVDVGEATTYSSEGTLFMTTVSVDTQVTFAEVVAAFFDDEKDIVMRDDVTGGESLGELKQRQRAEMNASKDAATQLALTAVGIGAPTGDGALIEGLIEGAPADGVLREEDVIVRVDGQHVATTCDVGRAIDGHRIGEPLNLVVRRQGSTRRFDIALARSPYDEHSPFLGVRMSTLNFSFSPGIDVDYRTGEIAGPSAGLMLSLALYDQLTPDDLTGGRKIAGTGTIECDGGVGSIGGIRQKVAGAEDRGAEIFLAPLGNAGEARDVAHEIEVVAIGNFDDAVAYLEGLE